MKIRLAILENDKNYLKRIITTFTNKYYEKIEVYGFSDLERALEEVQTKKIDILLVNEEYEINVDNIPDKCGFAYFVNNSGITELNNQKAICKYQKAELIYRQILGMYADLNANITGIRFDDNSMRIACFFPVSGGTGSSTVAAIVARQLAKKGEKVLYLNIEKFGTTEYFFEAEGDAGLSDVLYSIKGKKSNLSLKIESSVKRDASGVYFLDTPRFALDVMDIKTEELKVLIQTIRTSADYDYVIIDSDLEYSDAFFYVTEISGTVVFVGDGTEISNKKMIRIYESLEITEQQKDVRILQKSKLIYNKFSNKNCNVLENFEISNVCGAPRIDHANTKQIIDKLESTVQFADKIFG